MVELLSPAGDLECLKVAVQNGANAVYFGAEQFNARINSTNFGREELVQAIEYARLRGVKTHLTLNILIKNDEFEDAIKLVEFAYNSGIDAVIIQDLGLAKKVIELFPDLEVHSSTQMTIYNLAGVKKIKELGFSRCVLARELSINEIEHICKNTDIDIEVFIHGALCISYSGQCLMSSMIGGRSGNRGKCAGTCRLPYTLLKDGEEKQKGYLLSSKDVCTLDIIPDLINAGVKSFKIEGRMKSKEYVGTVTSIYRKYIDLAESGKEYIVDEEDREKLMQIFNRGGFSTGYLKGKLGKEMMYTIKPNHMGVLVGEVIGYNSNKGYAKIKLSKELNLGDSIAIRDASCKISELMKGNNNIKSANSGQVITVGRIKGRISSGDKVYRTVLDRLNKEIAQVSSKENIKRPINAKVILKENEQLELEIQDLWSKTKINKTEEIIVKKADNTGISEERIKEQLSKTGNTPFEMKGIQVIMDKDIIVPISALNSIRRNALESLEGELLNSFKRDKKVNLGDSIKIDRRQNENPEVKVSVVLNNMKDNIDYCNLNGIDNVYVPFKYFLSNERKVEKICKRFKTYLLLPAITKSNYDKLFDSNLKNILSKDIEGIVISNLSHIEMLKKYEDDIKGLDIIANYTLNITNNNIIKELENLKASKYIVPPELDKESIQSLEGNIEKEIIVYGRTLLMTTEYCTIGTLKNCPAICEKGTYKLKDRMGFEFPIYTDRVNCNNLIYNSKITSISYKGLNADSIRIDILEESEEEIQKIIDTHKNEDRLEGENYTNGNLNREI